MTQPIDLAAIKAICAAATPGPWRLAARGGDQTHDSVWPVDLNAEQRIAVIENTDDHSGDARFIAESRAMVPALVAEIERLRAEAAEAIADAERAEDGMLEYARRACRALRRWKSSSTYAPDPVGTIINYADALRAEVKRLCAEQKPVADRWAVYDPIEERYDFHGTEGSALQALDGIVDALRDRSSREVEGWDDNADQAAVYALVYIAGLELRTVATAGDGTEEGETCQRNGWSHIAEASIVRVGDDGEGKE